MLLLKLVAEYKGTNRKQHSLSSLRFVGYTPNNFLSHCKMPMSLRQQTHRFIQHWRPCLWLQNPCQHPLFFLASIPLNHTIFGKPGQTDLVIEKAHRDLLEMGRRKGCLWLSRDVWPHSSQVPANLSHTWWTAVNHGWQWMSQRGSILQSFSYCFKRYPRF